MNSDRALSVVGEGPRSIFDGLTDQEKLKLGDPNILESVKDFFLRMLDEGPVSPRNDFIPCPTGKRLYKQTSTGQQFVPENISVVYAEKQLDHNCIGDEVMKAIGSEAEHHLGAEHAFFLVDNPHRVRSLLIKKSLCFFGTIFRLEDKIGALALPNELFVIVLELNDSDQVVAEIKCLDETFDKYYPLAKLPL